MRIGGWLNTGTARTRCSTWKYHMALCMKYRFKILLLGRVAERAYDLIRRLSGAGCGGTGQHEWARVFLCDGRAVEEVTIKDFNESTLWDEDDQGLKISATTKP